MTAPSATESTIVDIDQLEALAKAAVDAEVETVSDEAAALQDFRHQFTPSVVLALLREVRAHREREASTITPVQAAVLTDALRYPENGALSCRWCKADRLEAHDAHCWYQSQVKKVDAARRLTDELVSNYRARQSEPAATTEGT